jgi:hypothetical protein
MSSRALLALMVSLAACGGAGSTALGVDGGAGVGGGDGGTGGVVRGHNDSGFLDDDAGLGGSGGGDGGSGGGGSGGSTMIDASPPLDSAPDVSVKKDARPVPDAQDICQTTCLSLEQDYQVAVKADQKCFNGVAGQCAKQVPGGLQCGCPVWVNSTVATDAIRKRFNDAGCNRCIHPCPAIACVNPGTGVCSPATAFVPVFLPDGAAVIAPPPAGQCMRQSGPQP